MENCTINGIEVKITEFGTYMKFGMSKNGVLQTQELPNSLIAEYKHDNQINTHEVYYFDGQKDETMKYLKDVLAEIIK